jgi:hypothetical protein
MNELSFTTEEKFLINYYKSNRDDLYSLLTNEATLVFPALLLVCFGAYYESYTLATCAILVYVVFKVREVFINARYTRIFSSIIRKFEGRITELTSDEKKSTSIRAAELDRDDF